MKAKQIHQDSGELTYAVVFDAGDEVISNLLEFARAPEPRLHAHVVVGKSDGTAYGGHLLRARVRPTLEVLLIEPRAIRTADSHC